jgi:ribonuclease PH
MSGVLPMMAGMARPDGRKPDELRPVRLTRGWSIHPEGSVLVDFGDTRVLCTASVTAGVPRWRKGSGQGWVTSEYSMLPRATTTRNDRESVKGRIGGRTHEISRLIGRSLRACIDLGAFGENSVVIDCDVLQADGGTRTAAITGAYVALHDAATWMAGKGMLPGGAAKAIFRSVSAVSVGVIDGEPRLDLCYAEDGIADVDMNIVCTGNGEFVEVQGTGEHNVFKRDELDALLDLGVAGCASLAAIQQAALAS